MTAQRLKIRLQHTDAFGVVYIARMVDLCHEAYEACMEAVGLALPSQLDGAAWLAPITRFNLACSSPLRLGDEVEIHIRCSDIRRRSFALAYRLERDGHCCATAESLHVAVQGIGGEAIELPVVLHEAVQRLDYEETV